MLNVFDAAPRSPQELKQCLLSLGKRLAAIVLPIELQQVKRAQLGLVIVLLRMLYSRAGDYPKDQPLLYAEVLFPPNTPEGACPKCHGMGRILDATEKSMVPDDRLTIRQRAVAAWPTAWAVQNLRILVSMGYDVDRPWRDLPKKDRDWILFTDEQPTVAVYAGYSPAETKRALKRKEEPSYQGTFIGARKNVLHTFANTQSALMKRRVSQYMVSSDCPVCHGKRPKVEALSVKFAAFDIADLSRLPLKQLAGVSAGLLETLLPGGKVIIHAASPQVLRGQRKPQRPGLVLELEDKGGRPRAIQTSASISIRAGWEMASRAAS